MSVYAWFICRCSVHHHHRAANKLRLFPPSKQNKAIILLLLCTDTLSRRQEYLIGELIVMYATALDKICPFDVVLRSERGEGGGEARSLLVRNLFPLAIKWSKTLLASKYDPFVKCAFPQWEIFCFFTAVASATDFGLHSSVWKCNLFGLY